MSAENSTESAESPIQGQKTTTERAKEEARLGTRFAYEVVIAYKWFIGPPLLVLGFIIASRFGLTGDLPSVSIPGWFWAYLVLAILVFAVTWPWQTLIIKAMESVGKLLHDVNPYNGDAALWELTEDQWSDLTVVNSRGEEMDKGELWHIDTLHGGYECVEYDPEENVAVVSWFGGADPLELRAYKKTLKIVEMRLSVLADLGIEESLNRTTIIREIVERIVRYLIKTHQKGTVPNGGEIDSIVTDVLREHLDDLDFTDIEERMRERLPAEYHALPSQTTLAGGNAETTSGESHD